MKMAIPKPLRYAIYTRKSTEHNLAPRKLSFWRSLTSPISRSCSPSIIGCSCSAKNRRGEILAAT
jgi:hypothetical protein